MEFIKVISKDEDTIHYISPTCVKEVYKKKGRYFIKTTEGKFEISHSTFANLLIKSAKTLYD